MTTVLACVLIQQWCREFMQYAYLRAAPHKRGRVRTYLFRGLRGFHIKGLVHVIHVIMQVSVFIFFCGVSDLFQDVYPRLGTTSWYCTIASAVMYMALSISPLVMSNSPYKTALTLPLLFGGGLLRFLVRAVWWYLRRGSKEPFPSREDLFFSKKRFLVEKANAKAEMLDPYAMKQLFIHHNLRDTDMDRFLEGLPGYIHSHFTVAKALSKALTAHHILFRIREHLLTCVTVTELSDEVRIIRASACTKSLGAILRHPTMTSADIPDEVSLQKCVLGIINDLNTLCEDPDEIVTLRALCQGSRRPRFLDRVPRAGQQGITESIPRPLSPLVRVLLVRQYVADTAARPCGSARRRSRRNVEDCSA
ncbi:hypothetical protein EDB89DRAFT_1471219 [Lactarius sanguifluus]|nr:hypothetical protein EDB89DRAFT_1471219 [Lactarius sanguifluus]